MKIEEIETKKIIPNLWNPNKIDKNLFEILVNHIKRGGMKQPILVRPLVYTPSKEVAQYEIIDGEHRWKASKIAGLNKIDCVVIEANEAQAKKITLAMNKIKGENSPAKLEELLRELLKDEPDLEKLAEETAFNMIELSKIVFDLNSENDNGSLKRDFIMPPFSILDARQGDWQERKRNWFGIIKYQEETREGVLKFSKVASLKDKYEGGTSIFDPVLSEILYHWFCPKAGIIFDPFAGDVSQSMVAGIKGYNFKGVELRQEQIDVHLKQAKELKIENKVEFFCDDATNLEKYIPEESIDFLLSCPPYFDLEQYSKDEKDLSNMSWEQFKEAYKKIIMKACKTLKNNRFACFVVSEVRNKKTGNFRGFVPLTIEAFEEAGLKFYNEIILVNAIGNLPLRIRRIWEASRKVGRTHQNILVFFKGENIKEGVNALSEGETSDN